MKNNYILLTIGIMALFAIPSLAYSAGPAPINLGTAGGFAILSKSGVSTTGTSLVTGNIGVSPAAASYITGFGLIANSSNQFATSSLVKGKIYAADYSPPTPTTLTTAVSNMQTAYTDAAGLSNPSNTELGAGNIGGMTLYPGLYKWSTAVNIAADGLTLNCNGNSSSVFVFQIAQTLNVANGAAVTLSGGCQPQNIFWQVAGQATLGTTSSFEGIILSQTAIVMNTGATLTGAALAQTAVTLDADTVTQATGSVATTTVSTVPPTTIGSTAPTTTVVGSGTTAPTTTMVQSGTTASTTVASTSTTTAPTTTIVGSGTITPPTSVTLPIQPTTVSGSTSFTWQGSGYYEISAGSPNIPAIGMKPGVPYFVSSQSFIQSVNSWLAAP
jgi:hypothetical protein